MNIRTPLAVLLLSLCAGFSVSAAAAETAVNKSLFGGLAIDGYDTVAYHLEQRPVQGKSEFRHQWNGATWQFASAANLKRFAAEPARYAPQYGGYCAYAVAAKNELVGIDPDAYTLVDGKLYLNYSKKIRAQWEASRAQFITQGDRNWPALSTK